MLLPDLHTDFSRGRSGGLVFPSLSEFPQFTVIHTVKGFGIVNKAEVKKDSEKKKSRSKKVVNKAEARCFSGSLLLFQ